MKLHELQIAASGASTQAQRQPGAVGGCRVAGAGEQGADATGGQHHRRRHDLPRLPISIAGAQADDVAIAQQQGIDIAAGLQPHMRSAFFRLGECVGNALTAAITTGMGDAGMAVATFQMQAQGIAVAVERHALLTQPGDRGRRLLGQHGDRLAIIAAGTGDHGVVRVLCRVITGTERGGNTALCQRRGAIAASATATE